MFSALDLAVVGKLCEIVSCSCSLAQEPTKFLYIWSLLCGQHGKQPGRGWMTTGDVSALLEPGEVLESPTTLLRWLLPRPPRTPPDPAKLDKLFEEFKEIGVVESKTQAGQTVWRPSEANRKWLSPDKIVLWNPDGSQTNVGAVEVASQAFAEMQALVYNILSDYEGHRLLSIRLDMPAKSEKEQWLRQQFYDFSRLYLRDRFTPLGWDEDPEDEKPYTVEDVQKAEETIRAMWLAMSGYSGVLENGVLLEPLPLRPKAGSPPWMGPEGLTSCCDIPEQIKEDVQYLEQRIAQPDAPLGQLWRRGFSFTAGCPGYPNVGVLPVQENGPKLTEGPGSNPLGLPWHPYIKKENLSEIQRLIVQRMISKTLEKGAGARFPYRDVLNINDEKNENKNGYQPKRTSPHSCAKKAHAELVDLGVLGGSGRDPKIGIQRRNGSTLLCIPEGDWDWSACGSPPTLKQIAAARPSS